MMSLAHRYTDFGNVSTADRSGATDIEVLEDNRLEAFEGGYKAGWEDAVKAHEAEQGKIATDLAQRFLDMSFTYHEAHAKLTSAMAPLLQQIVGKLLPDMAQATIGLHVLEQLNSMAEKQTDKAIEIAVAPGNLAAIQAIVSRQSHIPFNLVEEPALSAGQVYLRTARTERELNLDLVVAGITDAVAAFSYHVQTTEETANG